MIFLAIPQNMLTSEINFSRRIWIDLPVFLMVESKNLNLFYNLVGFVYVGLDLPRTLTFNLFAP